MIKSITYEGKKIELYNNINNRENIFSIIIGKNGTGKSRLLQLICEEYSNNNTPKIKNSPSRIIAVSTTPFDKFPLKNNFKKGYYYQGIRGIQAQTISKGYISKFIGDFLLGITENKINSLSKALEYLGYEDKIAISFRYIGGKRIENIINSNESDINESLKYHPYFESIVLNKLGIVKEYSTNRRVYELRSYLVEKLIKGKEEINQFLVKDDKSLHELFKSICNSPWLHKIRKLKMNIIGKNVEFNKELSLSKDLINLINSGLLKIENIILKKTNSKEAFHIDSASSGEQSVIMNILGISSVIKDNSLILIDEPEVCLHPEWQEKYIKLLIDIFKINKKCHFIITTHSPQIIANLGEKNCFITSIEDGKSKKSINYINKSSDFQLATLFNSPGFKNEYLTRLSLNLLSLHSHNK
ncbi:ATP-binding protein, partial [Xenorhabdus bovienii]|uniref:AAA family ATPase n=1 Tax=Xenorhabdus bovienii TaxID=40576 RepID=UPI001EDD0E16